MSQSIYGWKRGLKTNPVVEKNAMLFKTLQAVGHVLLHLNMLHLIKNKRWKEVLSAESQFGQLSGKQADSCRRRGRS